MYMPGRCRTGSSPFRTVMSRAVYDARDRAFVVVGPVLLDAIASLLPAVSIACARHGDAFGPYFCGRGRLLYVRSRRPPRGGLLLSAGVPFAPPRHPSRSPYRLLC